MKDEKNINQSCKEATVKYIIGLTGGIGTGKSMVLEHIKNEYNGFVIEADKIGHEIFEYNSETYNRVVEAFGPDILSISDDMPYIDRKKLGQIVFDHKEKLQLLNSITHPAIHNRIEELIDKCDQELIEIEAAILPDTSLKYLCDTLWYVYADKDIRISRLLKYRDIPREKALKVMANQPDDERFKNVCQVVIDNSYDKETTFKQIKEHLPGGSLWAK